MAKNGDVSHGYGSSRVTTAQPGSPGQGGGGLPSLWIGSPPYPFPFPPVAWDDVASPLTPDPDEVATVIGPTVRGMPGVGRRIWGYSPPAPLPAPTGTKCSTDPVVRGGRSPSLADATATYVVGAPAALPWPNVAVDVVPCVLGPVDWAAAEWESMELIF